MTRLSKAAWILAVAAIAGCGGMARHPVSSGIGPDPKLPPPEETLIPVVNVAEVVGWAEGQGPEPAPGLKVAAFARGLEHPRWLHVLPNGDVLVAETNKPAKPEDAPGRGIRGWIMDKLMAKAGAGVPSPDRITLLRDADGDGVAETRSAFLQGLHSPFGMALVGKNLYVANTDAVIRFAYASGATRIDDAGSRLVELPAGPRNHHWTKNLIASPDEDRLYVTVGSYSNVAENGMEADEGRAAIGEIDLDSGRHRIFASGLRNPNGMAWMGEVLWTVVNERDEIGSDLVPDYLSSVQAGGFYGWPYSYFGDHVDGRATPARPDLVAKAIKPDYALGPHTASLGLASAKGNDLPPMFESGMFVGQHGSWNRKPHSGYKVVFVPFVEGRPAGMPVDVLTGFLTTDGKARGRPVGVAIDGKGALLVADDAGNTVWRVSAANP